MSPAAATADANVAPENATPTTPTAADPEAEAEWEARTRPSRDAPRVASSYLRKDYAAACPQQHLAYLKCLKEAKSWIPSSIMTCHDEYKAFAICKHRAKEANAGPVSPQQQEQAQQPVSTKLWNALQREPLYMAACMQVQEEE